MMKRFLFSLLLIMLAGPAFACVPVAAQSTISSPGEYCLTQNIYVSSGNGVTITASNVILNMNGRAIVGPKGGFGAGVFATDVINVTVRGGNVYGFFYGIRINNGSGHVVSRVDASDNIFRGITILGSGAMIEYNRVKGIRGTSGAFTNSHSMGIETKGPATVRFNQVEEVYPFGAGEGVGISINDVGQGSSVYGNTIKFRFKPAQGRTLGLWTGGEAPATVVNQNVILGADYGLFRGLSTANAQENFVRQRCKYFWPDTAYPVNNVVQIIGGCTDPEENREM